MVKRKTATRIRKVHRYLGIFLGIQFLFWTISGLYFSWTDIDEIHGDQFRNFEAAPPGFTSLAAPRLPAGGPVHRLDFREIGGSPYYWINDSLLVDARTGELRDGITPEQAGRVAADHMQQGLEVAAITRITEVGPHHEYRGRPLPAFVVTYDHPEALKAYVSQRDGQFQTVRHRSWRWFDFLWMTHTMDYQGRDDFNTTVLRAFSLLGLVTVLSGFLLWFVTSPRIRRLPVFDKTKK